MKQDVKDYDVVHRPTGKVLARNEFYLKVYKDYSKVSVSFTNNVKELNGTVLKYTMLLSNYMDETNSALFHANIKEDICKSARITPVRLYQIFKLLEDNDIIIRSSKTTFVVFNPLYIYRAESKQRPSLLKAWNEFKEHYNNTAEKKTLDDLLPVWQTLYKTAVQSKLESLIIENEENNHDQ
jgi:hypothetical protein